jgi:hypothetical protein
LQLSLQRQRQFFLRDDELIDSHQLGGQHEVLETSAQKRLELWKNEKKKINIMVQKKIEQQQKKMLNLKVPKHVFMSIVCVRKYAIQTTRNRLNGCN